MKNFNSLMTEKDDLVAGLLIRDGKEKIVEELMGPDMAERGYKHRHNSLPDVVRTCNAMDGLSDPGNTREAVRTAFASLTLPYILSAVANKSALTGYNGANASWRRWCSIGSVSNFQTQTRARLTDRGELEAVNNAGEVAAGGATEEFEQFSVATYAKTFSITRTNIINDDMGAFTRTPQRMGRKAGLLVSKLVYTHLLANGTMGDGAALFVAAGHTNLNTSCALAEAGLSTAFQKFMQQTDADGNSIEILPRYLIVPPELYVTALRLCDSNLRLLRGTTDGTDLDKNIFQGLLEVVVEPRLSNSSYTGYSASTWYLAADPIDVDTVEVAFLNGREEPTIEKFDADPHTMGITYRIYLDVGVKALDWRGMSKQTA